MTFSSLTFTTLFFPAVLILYFICTDLRWRNGVLLVASLIFYSRGKQARTKAEKPSLARSAAWSTSTPSKR